VSLPVCQSFEVCSHTSSKTRKSRKIRGNNLYSTWCMILSSNRSHRTCYPAGAAPAPFDVGFSIAAACGFVGSIQDHQSDATPPAPATGQLASTMACTLIISCSAFDSMM